MNTEGAVKGLDPFIHVHQAEGMPIKAVLLGVKAPPVVKNLELDEAGVVRDNHINFVWRCVPQSIVNGFLADSVKNVLDVSRQLVGTGVANYVNRNSRIFLQPFGEGRMSRAIPLIAARVSCNWISTAWLIWARWRMDRSSWCKRLTPMMAE